jgi:tetratricopeptide (TPR) repeat protein
MVKYPYSQYHYKPRKKKKKFFLVVFLLLLVGGGSFYTIFYLDLYSLYANIVDLYRVWFNDYGFIEKDLDAGNYNVAIHQGLPYLEKRPYNARLLRYIGEAYYYISTSLTEQEKEESLNKAVILLRKGIVLSRTGDVLSKTYYLLGMSYFSKGQGFYELAAAYMLKSLDSGFIDPQIYEVLGYCYYKIGALENAEKYLQKAVETRPKDIARLYLAQTLKDRGKYESARRELDYLIQNSTDDAIVEESYAALVWIDFQEERFTQAKKYIAKILEMNKDSAFAHYWLGNIYEKEGDLISARKEWRLTLRINPKHIGAIDKLY